MFYKIVVNMFIIIIAIVAILSIPSLKLQYTMSKPSRDIAEDKLVTINLDEANFIPYTNPDGISSDISNPILIIEFSSED